MKPQETIEDFELASKLSAQQIVNKLIALLDIRVLYKSEIHQGICTKPVYIIILNGSSAELSKELRLRIDMIFREKAYSLYQIFSSEYVQEQFNAENLFFVYNLRKINLIYRQPENPIDPFPEKVINNTHFDQKSELLERIIFVIEDRLGGAEGMLEEGNFLSAALLYHGFTRDIFRIAELYTMGVEMESESVREHQSYVNDFVPELGSLFRIDEQNEQIALNLLDEVPIVIQQNSEYKIDKQQIILLRTKAFIIGNIIKKVISRQYDVLELKYQTPTLLGSENTSHKNNIKKVTNSEEGHLLEQVVDLLKLVVDLHSAYFIGSQNKMSSIKTYVTPKDNWHKEFHNFTLLIVTHTPIYKPLNKLTNDIYNRLPCRVFVISYTLEELCHKIAQGDNFLNRFLKEAMLIYAEDRRITSLRLTTQYNEKVWNRLNDAWIAQMNQATYLLAILENQNKDIVEESNTKIKIISEALKHICLGLLYVFWEFKPTDKTLHYLIHLCSHFTNELEEIFSNYSHDRFHILHLLSDAPLQLRFKTKSTISKKETKNAFVLVNDSLIAAQKVVDLRLKRLKRRYLLEAFNKNN